MSDNQKKRTRFLFGECELKREKRAWKIERRRTEQLQKVSTKTPTKRNWSVQIDWDRDSNEFISVDFVPNNNKNNSNELCDIARPFEKKGRKKERKKKNAQPEKLGICCFYIIKFFSVLFLEGEIAKLALNSPIESVITTESHGNTVIHTWFFYFVFVFCHSVSGEKVVYEIHIFNEQINISTTKITKRKTERRRDTSIGDWIYFSFFVCCARICWKQ